MAIRYEQPEQSPEERNREAREREEIWDKLAAGVTENDPEFKRWCTRHWLIYGIGAGMVFAGLMAAAISVHSKAHPNPKAFGAPFTGAAIVAAIGYGVYRSRIRKIALDEWSKRRTAERTQNS